jgi:lipoprotein-releasing system ATP-binding protein
VLRDVSFAAAPGEMLAIRGASGAGKSTLLHTLGGLERADGGLIRVGDFEVTRAHARDLALYRNERVGFVFQFHHLLPDLTAAENVSLPLMIGRAPRRDSRGRAEEILESVGLRERAGHPVNQLSGGEQQRVALARALIHSPGLILADEPTGNLDERAGDEVGRLLKAYCRAQNATAVIATHNPRLSGLCDRTLVLEDGRLNAEPASGGPGPD